MDAMDANVDQVVSVDPINYIAEIEGRTTYEHLVAETLKYSCLPTVVPPLKSAAIGDTVANKLKVQLVPVKKYLKVTHTHFNNAKEFFSYCQKKYAQKPIVNSAYFDGLIFHKNKMYAIESEFVNEAPFVSSYKYKTMYYQAIQHKKIDYLRVEDYLWRLDPNWVWFSKYFFMKKGTKNFLNKYRLINATFKLLTVQLFKKERNPIIQNMDIPIENAEAFLNLFQKEIDIKPLWTSLTPPYIHFSFIRTHRPNSICQQKIEQLIVKFKPGLKI